MNNDEPRELGLTHGLGLNGRQSTRFDLMLESRSEPNAVVTCEIKSFQKYFEGLLHVRGYFPTSRVQCH